MRKNMVRPLKRLAAAGMTAAMLFSLAACGGGGDDAGQTSGGASGGTAPAGTEAQGAADQGGGSDDGGAAPVADGETYNVVLEWLSIGNTPSEENIQKIEAAINEITVPEIGCTVTLYPVELGSLSNDTALAVSTGEKIDLVCSVGTGVGPLVDQGLIVPLDEYLESSGQNMKNCLGDALTGGYYKGELYGVPNAYVQSESYGFNARTDLLEKYNIEIDPDKMYTLDDLTEIFAVIKEGEGDGFYCVAGNTSTSDIFTTYYGVVDKLGATTASGGLLLADNWDNTTIENIYASEQYRHYAEVMYDWAQKGYIPSDAASNTDTDTSQLQSGNFLGRIAWTTPNSSPNFKAQTGIDMTDIEMTPPYKATDRYQNILWSVPVTSENPEKAFQFLDLLYGDNDLDSMLMFGLEGETWELVEDDGNGNRVVKFVDGVDATTAPFYCMAGVYGDRLSWPMWEPMDIGMNDMMREFNDSVEYVSPALGYSFEITDEVSSKYSAVTSVIAQYTPIISAGAVDPEQSLAEFNKALQDAGIDDIIAENQRQLDEWLAQQ